MPITRVLFCLTLVCLIAANCIAQDETKTSNPKAKRAVERATKTTTNQMMKYFAPAELTDEQKEKAVVIVKKHVPALIEARKAQDALLTAEQKKKRSEAIAKAKEEGAKGAKVSKAGIDALGLGEEELKKFTAAKKKLAEANDKLKAAIKELLTDEQKASLPKPKRAKGEKAKKKKKDAQDK